MRALLVIDIQNDYSDEKAKAIDQKIFEEVKKDLISQGIASNKICHI